jgi:hypothetical protein
MQPKTMGDEQVAEPLTKADFEALARFRFGIRRYLLVNRAQAQGLVHRAPHPSDARAVRVELTPPGQSALGRLSALHRDELRRMGTALTVPDWGETPDGAA